MIRQPPSHDWFPVHTGQFRGRWWRGVLIAVALLSLLAACSAGTPAGGSGPLGLAAGPYTPLGGVQKNSSPTASDFADLQASEAGKIGEPALVEFYADY